MPIQRQKLNFMNSGPWTIIRSSYYPRIVNIGRDYDKVAAMSWRCTFYGTRCYKCIALTLYIMLRLKNVVAKQRPRHTHTRTCYATDRSVGLLNRRYSKLVSLLANAVCGLKYRRPTPFCLRKFTWIKMTLFCITVIVCVSLLHEGMSADYSGIRYISLMLTNRWDR